MLLSFWYGIKRSKLRKKCNSDKKILKYLFKKKISYNCKSIVIFRKV